MELRNGAPATGINFYPRDRIKGKLIRGLKRGHVSFLGPRRTGKTSILRHLYDEPPDGFIPILINLERRKTVFGWLEEMVGKLKEEFEGPKKDRWVKAEKWGKSFKKFCSGLSEVTIAGTGFKLKESATDWRPVADEFLEMLVATDEPLLIMLDEFPWFLQFVQKESSAKEVEAVLQWFRGARQDLAAKRARFLVTGSIGLKGVLRRMSLNPAINDFEVVEIEPLSDKEALELLDQLSKDNNINLTMAERKQILKLIGANWPILLQNFLLEIQDAEDGGRRGRLKDIYERRLVGGNRNLYCDGMFNRLKDIFTASELRLARETLKKLVRTDDGVTLDELEKLHQTLVPEPELRGEDLETVLETLSHDGYLRRDKQNWRFASNVLRDFWRRKTT